MSSLKNTGTLRIIGGRWRSRRLVFPAVAQLRPTANRVRETLFNWLQNEIVGAICLDLFAGSGACGLEAFSRGAGQVTFVEQNRLAAAAIRDNLATLEETRGRVVCGKAQDWLAEKTADRQNSFDIVFLDPPYSEKLESDSCRALEASGILKQRALIYLESDRELTREMFPSNWQILKQKRAGGVYYGLLERRGIEQHG